MFLKALRWVLITPHPSRFTYWEAQNVAIDGCDDKQAGVVNARISLLRKSAQSRLESGAHEQINNC